MNMMMMMMMMMMMKGWEPPHRLIHNTSHGLLWNEKDALKSRLIDKLMSNGGEESRGMLRKFQQLFMSTILIIVIL